MSNLIFIDIETVAQKPNFDDLDPRMQTLREKKSKYICDQNNFTAKEAYESKAWIYSEFWQIVCIVIGRFADKHWNKEIITKIFADKDEKNLLTQFAETIHDRGQNYIFVWHNILEFDLPYLWRRMLVNKIPIPPILQLQNKKPRDILHVDTMHLWQFGDRKNYTSLDLLAAIFDIPTPKDDIDWSQVNAVYHNDWDLERISIYCEKDVLVTAKVYFALTWQSWLL